MSLAHLDTLIAFAVLMLGVSIIITVLTQAVSAILGLRGTNLLWATQTLLRTIHPALEAQAEEILRHPIISDSVVSRFFDKFKDTPLLGRFFRRWTLATAIRADELIRMLARRSQELRAAGGDSVAIANVIDSVLSEYDPEALRKAVVVRAGLRNLGQGYALPVEKAIQQMTSASRNGMGKIEAWFDTAMDRASERFGVHMRLWTILFSFALAFLAQIDTFKVLERLWSDPQARQSLVNSSDAVMQEAAAVLGSQTPMPATVPQVYTEALEQLKKQEPDAKDVPAMPPMESFSAAVVWLKGQLNGNAAQDRLVQEYTKLVATDLVGRANTMKSQIESSGLQLIPTPYRFLHIESWRSGLGMMVTAVLLSLGAPFWFNALKSLTSLRPVVAQKQDQEAA